MSNQAKREKAEQRWQGVGVSDGIAGGRVLRIHNGATHIYRATLDEAGVLYERNRLQTAVRAAHRQVLSIKERAERELGAGHAYIFDAHLLMLEDRKLIDEMADCITRERVNAEWAVKVVADQLLTVYTQIKDDYLRERGSDIEDVMRRILVTLSGADSHNQRLTEDAIIVAEDLLPSAMAELDFAHVRAFASDVGGWTSHAAILARGLGIPAIVGLRDLYRQARTGDDVVLNAFTGEVVLHPSLVTAENYQAKAQRGIEMRRSAAAVVKDDAALQSLRTLDGVEVVLRANVELPAEYEGVRRFGARGIGLYRSEFLLAQRGALLSEDEQCAAYTEVARVAGADGATVRLFDLGGDKVMKIGLVDSAVAEHNPALGLRAIRFSLQREEVLRTQVRAVLRAAAHGQLRIVLPMISDISDVRRARSIIDEERERLVNENHEIGAVQVGAMIEVPAAVLVADKLAREVDFFSVGTNDLVQYLLAVDRSNEAVASWFRSLHPAVLQSIHRTITTAHTAGIPAVVCGEMAATPTYAFVLIGLGATDLSMNPSSIPRIESMIANINAREAGEIAAECMECASADDVEELVRQQLGGRWPHLFPSESLPARRSG